MSIGTFVKGDSIEWECTLGLNITGWKLRCEVFDCSYSIKLANTASGGSDSEIEITDASNGIFTIKMPKDETSNFCAKEANIEIEVENTDSPTKKFTVLQDTLELTEQQITWEDPNA